MDVWRITLAALRRWYILLPILALTGIVAVRAGDSVDPEYQASATIMFVEGPAESLRPNPYGSLTGANEVVGIVLNSAEVRNTVATAHNGATYEVAPRSRTSILEIATRARSAEDAEGSGEAIIDAVGQELVDRQAEAGIPENARIAFQTLESPTLVAVVQNGKLRIQATVAVIGGAIALLAAVLFDDIVGLFRRNRRKNHRRSRVRRQLTPFPVGTATASPEDAEGDKVDDPLDPNQPGLFDEPELAEPSGPERVGEPSGTRSSSDNQEPTYGTYGSETDAAEREATHRP